MGACFHCKHIKFAFFLTQKYSCLNNKILCYRRDAAQNSRPKYSTRKPSYFLVELSPRKQNIWITHKSTRANMLRNQSSCIKPFCMSFLFDCHCNENPLQLSCEWMTQMMTGRVLLYLWNGNFFGDRWQTCSQSNNKGLLRHAMHIHFVITPQKLNSG